MAVVCQVMEIDEIANHSFPFVHPDNIDIYDRVYRFSAVIGKNHKMINSNDFISYNKDLELEVSCFCKVSGTYT